MRWFILLLICLLDCALLRLPAWADDPPKKLTDEERKELQAKWKELIDKGDKAYRKRDFPDAQKQFEAALEVVRKLHPKDQFPNGDFQIAETLNSLAVMLKAQGKGKDAEPHLREALGMLKRLYKGDDRDILDVLHNLMALLKDEGKFSEAETLSREGLEMCKRLIKGDHPEVAFRTHIVADLLYLQAKFVEAEKFYRDGLEMRRRLFKGDNEAVAGSLEALASLYHTQGREEEAEPIARNALEMRKRLFKYDHAGVASSLNNLANILAELGKYADAEILYRDALAMHKRLSRGDGIYVARCLDNLASLYQRQGRFTDAEPLAVDAFNMRKRLFKEDHHDLAMGLHSIARLYQAQGKYKDAEPLAREALNMFKRLFKGDNGELAACMNNVALQLQGQGKLTEAESYFRDALEMKKRLFTGDKPDVAVGLGNLASVLLAQGKLQEAEALCRESMATFQRLYKGDHPMVATSMNNLCFVLQDLGRLMEAENLCRETLMMRQRLFNGDHLDLAFSGNNLAYLCAKQGKFAEAEPLYREALKMRQRLFKQDHLDVAHSLNDLATTYSAQGRYDDAETMYRDALAMYQRLILSFATRHAEGDALSLISSLPSTRDAYLSNALHAKADPTTVYPVVWGSKGFVARIYEHHHQSSRAASTDTEFAKQFSALAECRRRRAELILSAEGKDLPTRQKRESDLNELEIRIAKLDLQVRTSMPLVERAERLQKATLHVLQNVLPSDAALVDYLRYTDFEYVKEKPGVIKEKRTARYLAFVVMKNRIVVVDLESAEQIESALGSWRDSISSGKELTVALPRKVRELMWEKLRKELPQEVKTVYICPDAALCRVPWAALPGDKPGTILLDDFAIATIPHAQFLLDKLWPQDQLKNPPTGALVVGGVKYDAEISPPNSTNVVSRGDPLLKPETRASWSFLPGTVGELDGVFATAERKKLSPIRIEDDKATCAAILAALPQTKYAHFATHGFFADPTFRSVFQLVEKEYEKAQWGERVGRAANSPLVMTGLVFAGANNPKTPGRGIITGESLIDLDLSGLELAVLSACETGLGDVAGGEGTFGLQRAFHMAGTRNVIASLWKVPDQSTAALMALFYRNLWEKNLSPMESLRQAQLEIYRNPGKIGELAKGFRGKFEEVSGKGDLEIKPGKDGTAHPLFWAAFTLSGPGK